MRIYPGNEGNEDRSFTYVETYILELIQGLVRGVRTKNLLSTNRISKLHNKIQTLGKELHPTNSRRHKTILAGNPRIFLRENKDTPP